jgi:hypothetical protein
MIYLEMSAPGIVYRAANSSVVVTKSGSFLEIRRGTKSKLKDARTWATKKAWMKDLGLTDSDVKESRCHYSPLPATPLLTADQTLMKSLLENDEFHLD